jgi:anti-anti-sigma factor
MRTSDGKPSAAGQVTTARGPADPAATARDNGLGRNTRAAGRIATRPGRQVGTRFGVIDEVGVIALYEDRLLRILLQSDPLALRLIGQADLTHRPALEQALRRAEQAMTDVLIDLAELEFIDVGGVRQMMDLAGVLAIDGRQVVISGVRPAVQPILQVCLWPHPANLQVKNANGQDLERPDAPTAPRKRSRGAPKGI